MKRALSKEEFAEKLRKEREERLKHVKPPPERKEASIEALRAFKHIFSHAVYGITYGDPKGYDQYHPPQMAELDLGREARSALSASRFITPDHPEWDALMRFPTEEEFKAAEEADKARAGLKTLKALYNGAARVSLRLQNGELRVQPVRHRGRGYWEGIRGQEDIILPETATDAELGAAIAAGLEISRKA